MESGKPNTDIRRMRSGDWTGLVLALVFLAPVVTRPLRGLLDFNVLHAMQPYLASTWSIAVTTAIPAVAIYLLLRLARAEQWLAISRSVRLLFIAGNAVMIVYLGVMVFASGLHQGGGFVVALFVFPLPYLGRAVLLLAIIGLIANSIQARDELAPRKSFDLVEAFGVLMVLAIPFVYTAVLYVMPGSSLRMSSTSGRIMEAKCATAGDRFLRPPPEDVSGVFLDTPYRNARIHLLELGYLHFVEGPYEQRGPQPIIEYKYQRVSGRRVSGPENIARTNELESQYGLFAKDIATDEERLAGVAAFEAVLRDLESGEVVATSTYYENYKLHSYCGTGGSQFDPEGFVEKALALKRGRFGARPPDPPVK